MVQQKQSLGVPTQIACVLIPRFNMMTLSSLLEPARIANYLSVSSLYSYDFYSFTGGDLQASNGMRVACRPLPQNFSRDDWVFVLGSWGGENYNDPALIGWLRNQARRGIRLCAVEIGTYLFARAGLLEGRMATTHWSYLPGFQKKFPSVKTAEQLFSMDGNIMTCAGGTAGIDLMLHLIQEQHGNRLVGEILDQIMHHPIRRSDDPQRRTLGCGIETLPHNVQAVIDLIEANINEPLTVPEIARRVENSQRQLERQFKRVVGCSVVQFSVLVRLQHARVLLISTDMGVRDIATASGFNSLSHFAFAFRKCFGRRPSAYRQAWPEQENAPTWPGTLPGYLETLLVSHRTQ